METLLLFQEDTHWLAGIFLQLPYVANMAKGNLTLFWLPRIGDQLKGRSQGREGLQWDGPGVGQGIGSLGLARWALLKNTYYHFQPRVLLREVMCEQAGEGGKKEANGGKGR